MAKSITASNNETPTDHEVEEHNYASFILLHSNYQLGNESLRAQYQDILFKEIIHNSAKDKSEIAKVFMNIAKSHIKLAGEAGLELKLQYYNDAATTCHYVRKLSKDNVLTSLVYHTLNLIQDSIIKLCGGNANILPKIKNKNDIHTLCHKGQLQELREQTKTSLHIMESYKENNEREAYINESALLFKEIARGMEKYLGDLFQETANIIGSSPCRYAVIGLGSMALRQMTPYSDLEFAILTENNDYRLSKDSLIQDYFKNLSHLVHFMIINLGETIIPISRFNLDLSEFVPQAVSFDLGGKTPLGRIERDKPYELIQTVEGMMHYLKNEKYETEHIDKNLATILQKVCFIYGEPELAKGYQIEVQRFLEQINETDKTNYELKAIKALWEGAEEFDYTKAGSSSKLIEGNLKQFFFDPYKSPGRLFDVKQDIYRLPDRLIYNLGLIYGVQEESSWDTLNKLYELGKISTEGSTNLKGALTFATNLRLKTYAHYGYQKETIDFSKTYRQDQTKAKELVEVISETFNLKREDLKPNGALFEYYKTILPLHKKLKEFCTNQNIENKDYFFASEEFYSNTPGAVLEVHLRLLQYEAALEQQLLELERLKASLGLEHPDVATCLNNVGITYRGLGKHEEALKYKMESLELRKKLLGLEHIEVAQSFNNVGRAYTHLGKHQEALKYKMESLELRKKLLGPEHIEVAQSLNNVGGTYGELGKHTEALQYLLEALDLYKKLLGPRHPDIATPLGNIGCIYNELGKREEALQYLLEALDLNKKLLGSGHPDIATTLSNMGCIYNGLGQHKEALQYSLEALELRKKLLGPEHPDVVTCLNNVGAAYNHLGSYEEALRYSLDSLKLSKKLLGEEHPEVAQSLNNVGAAYSQLDKYKEAFRYLFEALELGAKLWWLGHPALAQSLGNMRHLCTKLSDKRAFSQALDYFLVLKTLFTEQGLNENSPLDAVICFNKVVTSDYYKIVTKDKSKLDLDYFLFLKEILMKLELFSSNHLDITLPNEITTSLIAIKTVPKKQEEAIRVISYNTVANYFDKNNKTAGSHHHWDSRTPLIKNLLQPFCSDIMCLQELSPNQALGLHEYFGYSLGYKSIFLSQPPASEKAGAATIIYGEEVAVWRNKSISTPLIGTFISASYKFVEANKFWLNEVSDIVPENPDRAGASKEFDYSNTCRAAVLWAKVEAGDGKVILVFNSHYLLEEGNKTHLECAKLKMEKIKEIAKGNNWVLAGDRNILPIKDNNELHNLKKVHQERKYICTNKNHHGTNTIQIGFYYDDYQTLTKPGNFEKSIVCDVMISNLTSAYLFYYPRDFNPRIQELYLAGTLNDEENEGCCFTSNHTLIGVDLLLT